MTTKLIEPKATKPKTPTIVISAVKPIVASVAVAPPKFTPCRQCGNPGGCVRANRCVKGFK